MLPRRVICEDSIETPRSFLSIFSSIMQSYGKYNMSLSYDISSLSLRICQRQVYMRMVLSAFPPPSFVSKYSQF